MANLILETPVKLRLPDSWLTSSAYQEVQDLLGYEDLGVTHQYRTWKKALSQSERALASGNRPHWFALKYGLEALKDKVAQLDKERGKSILFRDDRGLWTYSGMAQELQDRFGVGLERQFELPEFGLIPWAKKPEHELRWFQEKAIEGFVGAKNGLGADELATGLGKSLIIVHTLKAIGLSAVVVAPTLSIANQLFKDLTDAFGTRLVGQFFEGKKQPGKMFVVAVSKSLMNCVEGDEATGIFSKKFVVIGDESHLLPAESLSRVILGLFGNIPYRFFLSGTQIRNDGADVLLQAITGPIQLKMSVRQGIEQGFLSPLKFVQWSVRSDSKFKKDDALEMNRQHLHDNSLVYSHASNLINRAVTEKKRRVLVLVDEVGQFAQLVKAGMNLPVGFAHGPLDAKNKKDVPEKYQKSDPMALVAAFDKGEFPVLVGSSCIGMGTDIKSTDFIVDLMGLASEVRVRQSVGRGTRLFPGKTGTVYNDYCVGNIDVLRNQARKRAEIFNQIYGPVIFMGS
jgi:superfamily II DNA or RNA helicase